VRVTGRSAHAVFPPALRGWLGPVAALAALVVVVLGARFAGHHQAGTVDGWIRSAVVGVRPPGWQSAALDLDALGEPTGAMTLVVTVMVGCLLLRRPRAAVLIVAGAGLAVVTSSLLKHVVGRTIHGENLSYPSGHTAFATAVALAVALLAAERLGRPAGTLLVLAALLAGAAMGWAEIALDAHYPTDVLGGWCVALAVVPATAWLVDRTADVGRRYHR